jgi:hypothetical protein
MHIDFDAFFAAARPITLTMEDWAACLNIYSPKVKASPAPVLLPGLHRDTDVAARLGMTVRAVRERALGHGIRRRPLFLNEAEVLQIMEPITCLNSPSVTAPKTGLRAARHPASPLKEALALATGGKPKSSLESSRTKPSKRASVVLPFQSPGSPKRH